MFPNTLQQHLASGGARRETMMMMTTTTTTDDNSNSNGNGAKLPECSMRQASQSCQFRPWALASS